jgi:hypothetical protein
LIEFSLAWLDMGRRKNNIKTPGCISAPGRVDKFISKSELEMTACGKKITVRVHDCYILEYGSLNIPQNVIPTRIFF